jgi:hypothetical protein
MEEQDIKKAVSKAKSILSDVPEPERSLSFPVVLSFLLNGSTSVNREPVEGQPLEKESEDSGESFEGLTGGMRRLYRDGFFKESRSNAEIYAELQRQGYHYPKSSLPFTLISFIQKRILNRMKGSDGNWRYVERK